MAAWYCFKCEEKMKYSEINLIYCDFEIALVGLVCPRCDAKFIPEELAVGKMAEGEKMIEEK